MLKRIAFLLSMLAVVPAASAQFSTAGMTLRPHFVGTAWTIDNTSVDAESGGGIGLGFDYGFSELIAAYVELSGSSIDGAGGESYALAHVDLGARFTFGSRNRPLRFMANVALTGRAAEIDMGGATLEASGSGFTIGGGAMYAFSRFLALDFNLQFTGGKIDEVTVGGFSVPTDVDASSVRANLGVAWHIGGR